jgi:tryptophan synthase alpha chain
MKNNKTNIMAHLVLGYPSLEESLKTAVQYVHSGVEILELQVPFSHPTADGPVITRACQEATRQEVSVADCLVAISTLREQFPTQEIMVMSYLNRVYAYGFQQFVERLSELSIRHLIVPDLPVDQAENFIPDGSPLRLVPVLAANVSEDRLSKLLQMDYDFFYLMSDFKITGSGFSLHPSLAAITDKIHAKNETNRVGIGFGISTLAQIRAVMEVADVAIIGSSLIQAQEEGRLVAYLGELQGLSN